MPSLFACSRVVFAWLKLLVLILSSTSYAVILTLPAQAKTYDTSKSIKVSWYSPTNHKNDSSSFSIQFVNHDNESFTTTLANTVQASSSSFIATAGSLSTGTYELNLVSQVADQPTTLENRQITIVADSGSSSITQSSSFPTPPASAGSSNFPTSSIPITSSSGQSPEAIQSSAFAQQSPAADGGPSTGEKAGTGVGVGIGVPIIVLLMFILLRLNRRRTDRQAKSLAESAPFWREPELEANNTAERIKATRQDVPKTEPVKGQEPEHAQEAAATSSAGAIGQHKPSREQKIDRDVASDEFRAQRMANSKKTKTGKRLPFPAFPPLGKGSLLIPKPTKSNVGPGHAITST
ncbi:MAG: hypothetical protein Q9160_004784 [Pyrenula sp. 1 TL-2023]